MRSRLDGGRGGWPKGSRPGIGNLQTTEGFNVGAITTY